MSPHTLAAFLAGRLEGDEAAAKAARVLRDVEAKRARLERHHPEKDPTVVRLYGVLCAWCSSIRVGVFQPWPCPDILDDLAVYSDHPDYRQEWRP